MTISLGVLDVLLFLLPGLVAVTWLNSNHRSIIFRVLPNAGSLTILMVVPLLALTFHTAWATAFGFQEFLARKGLHLFTVSFDPNVYKWVYLKKPPNSMSGIAIAYALFMLLMISSSPLLIFPDRGIKTSLKRVFSRETNNEKQADGEDWLAFLIRKADPDNRWLMAYIVTNQRNDYGALGYAGLVEKIGREADGNITFVVIDEVQTFYMKDTEYGGEMQQAEDIIVLPIHSFQREDYASISFEVGTVPDENFLT